MSKVQPTLLTRAALVAASLIAPHAARAQQGTLTRAELRVDAIDVRLPDTATLQLGAGIDTPLGYYVRLAVIGAGGVTSQDAKTLGSARADVLGRFLLDPFREMRWGLSVGGGISARYVAGDHWREYLVLLLELETPVHRGLVPALQLGLGGGLRVGVVLRPFERGRR